MLRQTQCPYTAGMSHACRQRVPLRTCQFQRAATWTASGVPAYICRVHVYVTVFQIQDYYDLALRGLKDITALPTGGGCLGPVLGHKEPLSSASLFMQQAFVQCLCNASCLPSAVLLHSLKSLSLTMKQHFCCAVISVASMPSGHLG